MCPNPQGTIVKTNKPVYFLKSNKHARAHVLIIKEIIGEGKDFEARCRYLPEGCSEDEATVQFSGFDETVPNRPKVGDVYFEWVSSVGSSWNTMENFQTYWELDAPKLEGIRPGFNLNKITNIDLRPALPTKDDPLFRNRDEVVEIVTDGVHRHTVLASRFRQFNPKIGDHFFNENGVAVFYTPQEFNRLVFTAFDAKYKQEQ